MSDLEKPLSREWWLVDESTDPADKQDRWMYGRFNTEKFNHLPEQFTIRVIEKSAYDAVVKERDELLEEEPRWLGVFEANRKLVFERDVLAAQLAEAKVIISGKTFSYAEIEHLEAQLAEYRGVDKTDHRLQPCVNKIERLERALAYAKQRLGDYGLPKAIIREIERLECG